MRKVFISTVSLQPVKAYKYRSDVYPDSSPTAFPITISLENNCNKGDKILIITLVTHSKEKNIAEDNYVAFCQQVNDMTKELSAEVEFKEIPIPTRIEKNTHQQLYKNIISALQDDDEIYADITYGFKYNPIVIFTALNHAYQTKNGVDVQEICYGNLYTGEPVRQEPDPELFDVTSLFYMNSISNIAGAAQLGNSIDLIPFDDDSGL